MLHKSMHFTAQRSRRSWKQLCEPRWCSRDKVPAQTQCKGAHVMHTYFHEFQTTHASQGKLHTFVNVRVSARNIDVVRDNATCAFEAHLPHVSDVPQATFRRCNTDIIHFIANRYLSVSVLAKSATRHHFQVRSYAFCM